MKGFESIWRYLQGEQKGKAANRLEREALSDPFLYEALEGFGEVTGNHEQVVRELERRLQPGVGERRRWKAVSRLLVAASILLVGGVAVWLLAGREEQEYEQAVVVAQMPKTDSTDRLAVVVAAAVAPESESIAEQELVGNRKVPGTELKERKMVPEGKTGVKKMEEGEGIQADAAGIEEDRQPEEDAAQAKDRVEDRLAKRLQQAEGQVTPPRAKPRANSGIRIRGISPVSQQPPRKDKAEQPKEVVIAYDTDRRGKRKPKSVASLATDWNKKAEGSLTWRQRFEQYVSDSLRYPEVAGANGIEGNVKLSVRLNKRGRPSRIKVMQMLTPECDREAVRLVEFYPGVLGDGYAGKLEITIPFRLKKTR